MYRNKKKRNKNKSKESPEKSSQKDIVQYLVKELKSDVPNNCAEVVSVPQPDEAALPCSTILGGTEDLLNKDMIDESLAKCLDDKSLSMYKNGVLNIPCADTSCGCSSAKKKAKNPTLFTRNSQITDYFPIRRSNRVSSSTKKSEQKQLIEKAILSGKEEGLEVQVFPDKGRGVIATRTFRKGDFVVEYYGELIEYDEAKKRESEYSDKENIGCYMYYFRCRNKNYCVDATEESGRLGRLVNHSRKGNLRTQTFIVDNKPHLILIAGRDIKPGEELTYDYGDRRKAAIDSHPWLRH